MGRKATSPKIIANRYAQAIYALAQEKKAVDPVITDLTRFASVLLESPVAYKVFIHPRISSQEKEVAMSALIKKGKAHKITADFLKLLIVQKRFDLYPAIVEAVTKIRDEDIGIHHVEAVTATKLTKKQQDDLEENLKQALNASAIDLKTSIDPGILGGILIRFGSTLVDDTIKNKLNRISQKMKGTA